MQSVSKFFQKLRPVLRIFLSIPWIIFWMVFAVVVSPFQIVYHLFIPGKQSHADSRRDHADQNFKRAIALIELHKIRFDDYPTSLQEQKFKAFLGGWDQFVYKSVVYAQLGEGYMLNLISQESLKLSYPTEFWNGLGLMKTNVDGFEK